MCSMTSGLHGGARRALISWIPVPTIAPAKYACTSIVQYLVLVLVPARAPPHTYTRRLTTLNYLSPPCRLIHQTKGFNGKCIGTHEHGTSQLYHSVSDSTDSDLRSSVWKSHRDLHLMIWPILKQHTRKTVGTSTTVGMLWTLNPKELTKER